MRVQRGHYVWGLLAALLLLSVEELQATLPLPLYPQCGAVADMDITTCPNDFNENWRFLSYIKDEYKPKIRTQEWSMGSGVWLDKALARETGDFRVTIAVLDSGIYWDTADLVNKHRLNTQELPLPLRSNGQVASSYDANGDGLVNIQDYAQDSRVSPSAGRDDADALLDPSDLLAVFSDGLDQDNNGYVDDIAGWDFFWNDNDPFDNVDYGHGNFEAEDSTAEGGNGLDELGTCPGCSLLNLRVGDSFVADVNQFAEAVVYAADNGVSVIQEALGTLNNSTFTKDALTYAVSKGVTIVASNADETSIHQNMPANNEGTLVVHAIRYDTDSESSASTYQAMANCTNFGGNLALSVPATECSSEATGRSAGLVGLVYSAALHQNLVLTPQEVWQIMIQTADDVDFPETYEDGAPKYYPSQPGWDTYFGYGRVNVYKAVEKVLTRQIPPVAEWSSPEWFQVLDPARTPIIPLQGALSARRSTSFSYSIEVAVGLSPLDSAFVVVKSGTGAAPLSGTLTQFDLRTLPKDLLDPTAPLQPLAMGDTNVERVNKVNPYTITLRLRITDAAGNKGEARRTVYVQTDPDALTDFPLYVGASLESSPKLADLNGDGRDEIIQATNDGTVLAIQANGQMLPGWPVRTRRIPSLDPARAGAHTNALAYRTGLVSPDRGQALLATPAVGDVNGDGNLDVVIATLDGDVYVFQRDGSVLPGFPATLDWAHATEANTSSWNFLEAGFFSSPALGDLDQNGTLEIVVGGMDQWLYVFDASGRFLPGWPVHLRYQGTDGSSPNQDRIMTSPAIGDLDGDGSPEVVIGTNEIVDGNKSPTYALHAEGNLHPDGPMFPGWPILTAGLYADILPSVGKGTCSSPALADIDGDGRLEVATHTVTGYPTRQSASIYRFNGRPFSSMGQRRKDWGGLTNTDEPAGFVTINSGSFGDVDQDGDLDYVLNMGGFNALLNLMAGAKRIEHNYLVGAWDARTGQSLVGFPQQVADLQFFMNPAIADLNGDGLPEVISGNGAFTVDAFDRVGEQPAGWPKFTGQWNIAAPAVGDLDGDGFLEVVQSTRSGYVYAWHTTGQTAATGGVVEWASFHHDAQNTGNYQHSVESSSTMPLAFVRQTEAASRASFAEAGGCQTGPAAPASGVGLLVSLVLAAWRRQRGGDRPETSGAS